MKPKKKIIDAAIANGSIDRLNMLLSAAHLLNCEANNLVEEASDLMAENSLLLGDLKKLHNDFVKVADKYFKEFSTLYSAASATGNQGAASATGKDSIALAAGYGCKAKGAIGCWIVLAERGEWNGNTYPIKEVKAFEVDGKKVKADTWYMLVNGQLKEV